MINSILTLFNTSLSAVIEWFRDIFLVTETATLYVAMMCVAISIRVFLAPILGSGQSDVVSKSGRSNPSSSFDRSKAIASKSSKKGS